MLLYFAIAFLGLLLLLVTTVLDEVFDFLNFGGLDDGAHPLSGRVLAIGMTIFGCVGLLTRYYGWGTFLGAVTSGLSAIFAGALTYWLMTVLYSQTASTDVSISGMRGRIGEVTVNIPAGSVGEVLVPGIESTRHMVARSRDGAPIPSGTSVRIIEAIGNIVIVERAFESSSVGPNLASAKE